MSMEFQKLSVSGLNDNGEGNMNGNGKKKSKENGRQYYDSEQDEIDRVKYKD